MSNPAYDHDFWEQLWSRTLREHAEKVASRPPSSRLVAALTDLRPGLALDADCGHGAETLWLAARGWRVMVVDYLASVLDHALVAGITQLRSACDTADIVTRYAFPWPVPAHLGTTIGPGSSDEPRHPLEQGDPSALERGL